MGPREVAESFRHLAMRKHPLFTMLDAWLEQTACPAGGCDKTRILSQVWVRDRYRKGWALECACGASWLVERP